MESRVKKLADEQVQKENEKGQKRLEDEFVNARKEFMTDKAEAVQQAREEEQAIADEQVQKEKEEGQKRLKDALVKAREKFMTEKAEAVQQVREEEREIATEEAKKQAHVEEDIREQLILAEEKKKQVNI